MNGRVYDYNSGRFLSVDPYITYPSETQAINPYSYIMNNPMAGTDPTGYFIWGVIKGIYKFFSKGKGKGKSKSKGQGKGKGDTKNKGKDTNKGQDKNKNDDKNKEPGLEDVRLEDGEGSGGSQPGDLEAEITNNGATGSSDGNVPSDTGSESLPDKLKNKIQHTFNDPKHNLEEVITDFKGDKVEAFKKIKEATQELADQGQIEGVYETTVKIKNNIITVTGKVINGKAEIGTFYIP